jgi:hypothetical protein
MVQSVRKTMKTDVALETGGIEFEYGNVLLKVARAGGQNQSFNKAVAELANKHRRALEANMMDNDEAQKIGAEIYAKHVVLKWQTKLEGSDEFVDGVEDADGNLVPDTVENRVAFFLEVPDFLIEVKRIAENFAYFRANQAEQMAKNS